MSKSTTYKNSYYIKEFKKQALANILAKANFSYLSFLKAPIHTLTNPPINLGSLIV
ncbi:hypothetical protein J2Z83_000236 [Virgibacillus natechei]|uniref:Uncharacterized protein n=1 Tax=Virgibacillus natechei TaxID=1216297 RepID=A0ABS4IB34_9BACI|nr:hypothetical protein [Virgibacillus natechei]